MEYQEFFSLKTYNTLALNQCARYFGFVSCESEVEKAVAFADKNKIPLLMLGEGSNLVLSQDYPGLVIKNEIKGITVISEDNGTVTIEVGAGENWHALVCHALKKHWFGLENLALIPGTVGAAPVQNIGAYGVEICEFIESVRAFDSQEKKWKTLSHADCQLTYRDSIFKQDADRYLISAVQLKLLRKPKTNVTYQALQDYFDKTAMPIESITPLNIFDAVVKIRQTRLPNPDVTPNAGSFFKNPLISAEKYEALLEKFPTLVSYPTGGSQRKLAAAWLIDQAGWKGVQQGKVAVHDRQALVLVNCGGANGKELLTLANDIRKDVKRRYDVDLDIEPTVI